jgi:hypothetical protein
MLHKNKEVLLEGVYFRLILTIILFCGLIFMVGCDDAIFSSSKTNNDNEKCEV